LLASESIPRERLADAREAAVLALSVALIDHEASALAQAVAGIRDTGCGDLEIYDIGQAAAMFAWANRLMQTLGEPTE
jgi:alkylhydroperoxidase family enzyme